MTLVCCWKILDHGHFNGRHPRPFSNVQFDSLKSHLGVEFQYNIDPSCGMKECKTKERQGAVLGLDLLPVLLILGTELLGLLDHAVNLGLRQAALLVGDGDPG